MSSLPAESDVARRIAQFVLEGFAPRYGDLQETVESSPVWRRIRLLGTDLWLDTGSIQEASDEWTAEFSALTTNNTLLNKEVQTGRYDDLIARAAALLAGADLSDRQRTLEIAFILNAYHALRLVEKFGAFVSVEEHTALADDVDGAVDTARRYHRICPERFLIKIPFTPAGLLAARRLAAEGVAVNHTLGFSARQNYVVARLARPAYANVFLGRLNSFVDDNALGDGTLVGLRATLASQAALRDLAEAHGTPTRQIGASFRAGTQVRDLVGIDVMTVPPGTAREMLDLNIPPAEIADRTGEDYRPTFAEGADPAAFRADTLWDIGDEVVECCDAAEAADLDNMTAADLVRLFAEHGCGDLLVAWTDREIAVSGAEGKIPRLDNWAKPLAQRRIGLDSLLNLAGLNAFKADQAAMDARVADVLAR